MNLETVLETAEAITRQAGEILRLHYERARESMQKSTEIDLVTAADKETEAFIVELLAAFPGTHIVGEEGGGYGRRPIAHRITGMWILDGTVNLPTGCRSSRSA